MCKLINVKCLNVKLKRFILNIKTQLNIKFLYSIQIHSKHKGYVVNIEIGVNKKIQFLPPKFQLKYFHPKKIIS